MDILSPEFLELAEKVKVLYAEKERKTAEFKELWMKHKSDMAELEAKAQSFKDAFQAGAGPSRSVVAPVVASAATPVADVSTEEKTSKKSRAKSEKSS